MFYYYRYIALQSEKITRVGEFNYLQDPRYSHKFMNQVMLVLNFCSKYYFFQNNSVSHLSIQIGATTTAFNKKNLKNISFFVKATLLIPSTYRYLLFTLLPLGTPKLLTSELWEWPSNIHPVFKEIQQREGQCGANNLLSNNQWHD